MAIQQNFPDEGPTLNLNFAGSRTLDPRITFTRTSNATYMGSDGLIKIAPINSPRFDHSYNPATGEIQSLGLLVEESRSNLLMNSESLNINWGAFGSSTTIIADSALAPGGKNNADAFQNTSSSFGEYRIAYLIDRSDQVVFSIYAKNNTHRYIQFRTNSISSGYVNFDLDTVTFAATSASGLIQDIGNGWRRCVAIFSATSITNVQVNMISGLAGNFADNWAPNGTVSVYLWGAQLETGSFPTSYIPTTAATATRTAEIARIERTNFSSWYNQNEGTIISNYSTYKPINAGNSADFAIISSEAIPLDRIVGWQNIFQVPLFSVIQNNTSNFLVGKNVAYINRLAKKALALKTNNMIVAVDGDLYTSDLASGVPDTLPTTFNRMILGNEGIFASYLNGHIQQFVYYPTRLPNSTLQALTR